MKTNGQQMFNTESTSTIKIAPSLLASDFTKLGEEIREVEEGGADILHVDVMDGRFVPNITIGLPVVKAISRIAKLPLDCHLMIVEPSRYAVEFVEAGASMVSVHVEAEPHLHRTLTSIREAGAKAGIAINPATSLTNLEEALPYADFVLLMTVNPGFGGQSFIATSFDKIRRLSAMIREKNLNTKIEVDGGVDATNIAKLAEVGAEIFVAGSSIYGKSDRKAAIKELVDQTTIWV